LHTGPPIGAEADAAGDQNAAARIWRFGAALASRAERLPAGEIAGVGPRRRHPRTSVVIGRHR